MTAASGDPIRLPSPFRFAYRLIKKQTDRIPPEADSLQPTPLRTAAGASQTPKSRRCAFSGGRRPSGLPSYQATYGNLPASPYERGAGGRHPEPFRSRPGRRGNRRVRAYGTPVPVAPTTLTPALAFVCRWTASSVGQRTDHHPHGRPQGASDLAAGRLPDLPALRYAARGRGGSLSPLFEPGHVQLRARLSSAGRSGHTPRHACGA